MNDIISGMNRACFLAQAIYVSLSLFLSCILAIQSVERKCASCLELRRHADVAEYMSAKCRAIKTGGAN